MKTGILFVLTICFCVTALSQERVITMPKDPKTPKYVDYKDSDNGYWSAVEGSVGSSIMFNQTNIPLIGLSWINGYRFNEYLRAGFGFGAACYLNNNKVRESSVPWAFPLYADLRGNFITQTVRNAVPYWSLDVGRYIRDGFFVSPTLGFRIGEKRSSILLGISYSYNEVKIPGTYKGKNFLLAKVGYEF